MRIVLKEALVILETVILVHEPALLLADNKAGLFVPVDMTVHVFLNPFGTHVDEETEVFELCDLILLEIERNWIGKL